MQSSRKLKYHRNPMFDISKGGWDQTDWRGVVEVPARDMTEIDPMTAAFQATIGKFN